MFEPVASDVSFPDLELELLEFWRTENVFRRSLEPVDTIDLPRGFFVCCRHV